MTSALRIACLSACLVALAACQSEKTEQKGAAEGEILPGSASDAMLPYDTVRSEPPLAPLPAKTGSAATRKGGEDGEGDQPADEASPAAATAPTPEATEQ